TLDDGDSLDTVLRVMPMNLPPDATFTVTDTAQLNFPDSRYHCTNPVPVGANLSSTVTCTQNGLLTPVTLEYMPALASGAPVSATPCQVTLIPKNGIMLPTLGTSPPAQSVPAGQQATYNVSINGNGSSAPVSLAASGLPSGVTAAFAPNPATTASTLSLATA